MGVGAGGQGGSGGRGQDSRGREAGGLRDSEEAIMDCKGHGRSPRTKGQNFATPDKSLQYKKHRGEGEPPKGTTELIKLHQWQSLLM